MFNVELEIQGQQLDVFQNEGIEIVNAVQNIEEIDQNIGDYSQNFKLPASPRNNKIFKHYYNAEIDNGFDARKKVSGAIRFNGVPFRRGKWKLNKVNVKDGQPVNYDVNFFSQLVDLKDKIGKDELTDLDLSAFDHAYNATTVKTGLTSGLFSGAVRYTLMTKRQYYYNSAENTTNHNDELRNIAYTGTLLNFNGVHFDDVLPSIQAIKIIEAIETKYDITFSRDFFGTAEFQLLYLWVNGNADDGLANEQVIDWTGGDNTYMNLTTDIGQYPVQNTPASGDRRMFWLFCKIVPEPGFVDLPYTLRAYRDGTVVSELEFTFGTQTLFTILQADGFVTYDVYYTIESNVGSEFQFTAVLTQELRNNALGVISTFVTNGAAQTVNNEVKMDQNLPEIETLEFLKGLFKAFKLVVIPNGENSLYVNTLNAFYATGTRRDISKYIDWDNVEIEAGKLLNPIVFKFQNPTTILNEQFFRNEGLPYGDELAILTDDDEQLLDGEEYKVELPFEKVVFDRLIDLDTEAETNVMYSPIIDIDRNPVNSKPILHYTVPINISSSPINYFTGLVNELIDGTLFLPFHAWTLNNPINVFSFGSERSEWNGELLENTLYKNHWENFIAATFDPKKRVFKYDAYLPRGLARQIELNDVIVIKGRSFRIDRYTYEVQSGKASFKLINTFDNAVDVLDPGSQSVYLDFTAQTTVLGIANLTASATDSLVDYGFGTGWLSVTPGAGTLDVTVTENTTGKVRDAFIEMTLGSYSSGVYVLQYPTNPAAIAYVPEYKFDDERNSFYLTII